MSGSHKMCVQHQNLTFCFTIMKNEQIIQVFCYQVIVFIPNKCLIQLFTAYEILSMRETSFSCLCGTYHFVTTDIFFINFSEIIILSTNTIIAKCHHVLYLQLIKKLHLKSHVFPCYSRAIVF